MAKSCVLSFLNFLKEYLFFFKDLCPSRPICLRTRFFMLINIKFRSTSLGLMVNNISLEVTSSKPVGCRDVWPLAKSQVIGIFGLQVYSWEVVVPMVKQKILNSYNLLDNEIIH